jgi:NTF2 fold immunity protein
MLKRSVLSIVLTLTATPMIGAQGGQAPIYAQLQNAAMQQQPKKSAAGKTGEVADSATAVKLAEKALIRIYGGEVIKSERPFTATLSDGVWHVGGTLHCKNNKGNESVPCVGGVAMADIRQSDGRVLRTGHTM